MSVMGLDKAEWMNKGAGGEECTQGSVWIDNAEIGWPCQDRQDRSAVRWAAVGEENPGWMGGETEIEYCRKDFSYYQLNSSQVI